jgi:hypothetical protein
MARFLKGRWALLAIGAVVSLVLAVSAAQAGKITLGSPVATPDGGLDVSVNVTPDSGQDVAALQFDLHYDSSQYGFADATAGGAATGAGKDAVVSETELGMVRVVVAGINQDALGSGTVATLHFDRMDKTLSSPSFSDNATLDEVVASGPSGENIEGLGVSAEVSESALTTATTSDSKTASTDTSASVQNTAGQLSSGVGATGTDQALESAQRTLGTTNQRNTTSTGASVGSRLLAQGGGAQVVMSAVPQVSSAVSSRHAAENTSAGKLVRGANPLSPNSGQVHRQPQNETATPQNAGGTGAVEPSSRPSSVSRSSGNSERTLVARAGAVSAQLPAVSVLKTVSRTPKINDSSNYGMVVLLAGSGAVLILMFGAWALRRR